jgi:hypothetical protein
MSHNKTSITVFLTALEVLSFLFCDWLLFPLPASARAATTPSLPSRARKVNDNMHVKKRRTAVKQFYCFARDETPSRAVVRQFYCFARDDPSAAPLKV